MRAFNMQTRGRRSGLFYNIRQTSLCRFCVLRMFKAPHMKTCVNQLRLVLTLKDTHTQHERTFCSHSALRRSVLRGDELSDRKHHRHFCSNTTETHPHTHGLVSSRLCVLYTSEWIRLCAHFLLRQMSFSWLKTPNTYLHLLYTSLNASPSRCPATANQGKCLLPESKGRKSQNSPESGNKRVTCDRVYEQATIGTCSAQRWSNISPGLWSNRPAVLALQTRWLHRNTQQRPVVDGCLSAVNEARCRCSLQPNAALYEREGKSWAAVLVCLCAVSGEPALLFTLRSAKLKGRHKGDVSFAGGKKDASDRTVVETALREAREELGIHVAEDKVWGVLKPLRDMSGMIIAPVIANLGSLEALSFQPNPSEVEEIFTVTLEHLCQPQNKGYTHFRTGDRYGYTLPVFHSPKYRVWGLTAVALDHALKLIVPPEQLLDQRLAQ